MQKYSTPTTIYFVRHAEADKSIRDGRIRHLTDKGIKDCKLVTDFLREKNFTAIFSSPFKRAIDTINGLADALNLKINIVEDFREQKSPDIDVSILDFFLYLKRQWADFNYKIENGETLAAVQNRNINALNECLENYQGKNIVIATHGTALSTIINFYDNTFNFTDFNSMVSIMPWIVKMTFNKKSCIEIEKINLFHV